MLIFVVICGGPQTNKCFVQLVKLLEQADNDIKNQEYKVHSMLKSTIVLLNKVIIDESRSKRVFIVYT